MLTVKLLSYDNKKDDVAIKLFDLCDETLNHVSIIEKLLKAAVLQFYLISHTVKHTGLYHKEIIVISFPSYLCSKLDDISDYLRIGVCLTLVIDND